MVCTFCCCFGELLALGWLSRFVNDWVHEAFLLWQRFTNDADDFGLFVGITVHMTRDTVPQHSAVLGRRR
jgi:hypothetical protein